MPEYLQRNFGPSFRTEQAMREIERAVCTGIHEERKLLFTDGLAREAYEGTDPRARSLRASYEKNLEMLRTHEDAARQGRRSIEQAFRNALSLRSEPEIYRADHGTLDNAALWRDGRCEFPLLFEKIVRPGRVKRLWWSFLSTRALAVRAARHGGAAKLPFQQCAERYRASRTA